MSHIKLGFDFVYDWHDWVDLLYDQMVTQKYIAQEPGRDFEWHEYMYSNIPGFSLIEVINLEESII